MSNSSEKQHYVQQAYLKLFSPESENGKIFVYDKIINRVIPGSQSIINFAHENNFYDIANEDIEKIQDSIDKKILETLLNQSNIDTDEYLDKQAEKHLTSIKNIVEKFLNGKLKKGAIVKPLIENIESISQYCTFQYLRTKSFREYYAKILKKKIIIQLFLITT